MGGPQNTYRSLQCLNMNMGLLLLRHAATWITGARCLQVDPYGNINSTYLGGTFANPTRRFAGSGGGNQVASHCWKTIIVIKHEGRRFVPKVDFITSPGYLDGPGAREKAGLPRGTGPHRVVTSKALFGFDGETRKCPSPSPGASVEEVEGHGVSHPAAPEIGEIPPPTDPNFAVREEIAPTLHHRGEKCPRPHELTDSHMAECRRGGAQ